MLWQRALVTLTIGPLVLWLIYMGGWFFFLPVLAFLLIGTAEYANFTEHLGWRTPLWLMMPMVALLVINANWPSLGVLAPTLTFGFFVSLVYALWRYERQQSKLATGEWLGMVGGVFLLGWLGSHFIFIRQLDETGQWTLLTILTIWIADTFAYLAGSRYGRHQLVPHLSPKKSVEGYVAGILVGTVGAGAAAYFFPAVPFVPGLLLVFFLTLIAPVGDLGISLFKREAGVKDSGQLFPGHGGALDRLDTLLWGVAISYYVITLFIM